MQTIGERIAFLREERNMSQKCLASLIQVTPATMSRYENNIYEPKGAILSNLARALQTTSDFLLGLSDNYELPKVSPSSAPKASDGLTAEEQRLLSYYRRLSHDNKIRAQERVMSLFDFQHH